MLGAFFVYMVFLEIFSSEDMLKKADIVEHNFLTALNLFNTIPQQLYITHLNTPKKHEQLSLLLVRNNSYLQLEKNSRNVLSAFALSVPPPKHTTILLTSCDIERRNFNAYETVAT
ncbi:MAG: hypothetical protein COA90_01165 [Gammaproteobacteria bacterium]|nr:MAG: hypothetical protein COA90_01165 [Gammaproteobacteria bacterium]